VEIPESSRDQSEELALAWLWWYPSYVVSSILVALAAFGLSLMTRPPGLLQWVVTVVCLVGGTIPAHWLSTRLYEPVGKRVWTSRRRGLDGGCLVVVWAGLLGLLFPVLAYLLVRIFVPPTWSG
jgi:hypothetical protein